MKTENSYYWCCLMLALLGACSGEPDRGISTNLGMGGGKMETTASGVKYRFYRRAEGELRTAKAGDLLTFHIIVQNHRDSTLRNTYRENPPAIQELPLEETYFIGKRFFRDIFSMVAAGDSLSFWIATDSLAKQSGYLATPATPAGTHIKYTVKILKIQSREDIQRENEAKLKAQRQRDEQAIDTWIDSLRRKQPKLNIQSTASGLRYFLRREGKGRKAIEGDTLEVQYVGKLLSGMVYDHSQGVTELLLGSVYPPGLDEGLGLLSAGSSATFLLPSALGFGESGMENVVPPNTVLVFEVELLAVKSAEAR